MVAVLSALQAEIYHIEKQMKQSATYSWAGTTFLKGVYAGKSVVVGHIGAGIAQSALSCQYICDHFQPECILMGGIGGALHNNIGIGDIIVARDVLQWDVDTSGVGGGPGVFPGRKPDGKYWRELSTDENISSMLKGSAEEFLRQNPSKRSVAYGRVLSGDSFVALKKAPNHRKQLHQEMGGDTIDMESSSVMLSGLLNSIPTVVMRVISDTPSDIPRNDTENRNIRERLDAFSKDFADICRLFLSDFYQPL